MPLTSPMPLTQLAASRGMRWAKIDHARLRQENLFYRTARALYSDFEREILRRLEGETDMSDRRTFTLVDPMLFERLTQAAFDVGAWNASLQETGRSTILRAVDLTVDVPIDTDDLLEANQRWLKTHVATSVKSVKGTQLAALKAIIADGFATEGKQTADIVREIKGHFSGMKTWQARRIAQTESAAFFGRGSDQAILMAGIAEKEWLSARDDLVRPTHETADGQRVPAGADFTVGAGSGPHPGAISDDAENFNCRCLAIAAT